MDASATATQDARRKRVRDYIDTFGHDDPDSVPAEISRYMTVERFKDGEESTDGDGIWLSFGDEMESLLADCAVDYEDSGYVPFMLVDLDTGDELSVEDFELSG